ncbi:MAG: hypothetical protein AUI83_17755 [Armatimonadetes bacterium 13_1_40CM_3_65_7]|uniref:EfeO-type cupredoxin-like domain-containing protein n=1 Tax=Candidatus Segetimicrobium genomatis TaxID=2569760 RepID=A0A537LCK5_9BACT|nr:MAG: hypothetical protein AUI83_17755 [Armatimonadetes bacterium 13_1_40CM_3_65_7]TMJ05758.1 MAG: hypothetical protein E6H01_02605 [Terrabacteria group bacterium ANGP1]
MRQLGVVVMLIGVVLAWTGSAAASHTGWYFGSGGPRITVTMSEWKFTPATITLEAGKPVDIILENKGVLAHVFMVYTKPKQPLPSNASDRWEYVLANSYLSSPGEIMVYSRNEFIVAGTSISEITLEPGKKATLTFVPSKKGTFEFACLILGGGVDHYKSGMMGTLIVK